MADPLYLQIALPVPLRQLFDYRCPPSQCAEPGCRVRVNFGGRTLVGVVISAGGTPGIDPAKVKTADRVLDDTPLIGPALMQLIRWSSDYYHAPLGEALQAALPARLRQGEPPERPRNRQTELWCLTPEGQGLPEHALKKAPKQALALTELRRAGALSRQSLKERAIPADALKRLADKALITTTEAPPDTPPPEAELTLNPDQKQALERVALGEFEISLLYGTTGSGKTEVYLQLIARLLACEPRSQILVLVPEIGLTPQTLARFRRRFGERVACLHSGLNDTERLTSWLDARDGRARIIIGTRSAIFTQLPHLGLIVVDEEHDTSFKQQDGFRYCARDLAGIRAKQAGIPLLLGSATPSLETLHNALTGRYQLLNLHRRAGGARTAPVQTINPGRQAPPHGLTGESLEAIEHHLSQGNQVLVFLNRRGYAPTLQCMDCGEVAECPHCDARLTLHHRPRHLHCHHCDYRQPIPGRCGLCHSHQLAPVGTGTERSEDALAQMFPTVPVHRIDRDATRGKAALEQVLEQVHRGGPCVLVGTQMLAKGHHFPDVTLVIIVDVDGGLFSADFRGPERMGQVFTQVAGRAGRARKTGQVLLQTRQGDHPLLRTLIERGYRAFAEQILAERELTRMPPYAYLALLRADDPDPARALQFLQRAREIGNQLVQDHSVQLLGPLPALMERRGQRYRFQIQAKALSRGALQRLLGPWVAALEAEKTPHSTRWSVDVDPQDMG